MVEECVDFLLGKEVKKMTDKKDSDCGCGCLPKGKKDTATSRPKVKTSEKPKR